MFCPKVPISFTSVVSHFKFQQSLCSPAQFSSVAQSPFALPFNHHSGRLATMADPAGIARLNVIMEKILTKHQDKQDFGLFKRPEDPPLNFLILPVKIRLEIYKHFFGQCRACVDVRRSSVVPCLMYGECRTSVTTADRFPRRISYNGGSVDIFRGCKLTFNEAFQPCAPA